MFLYRFVCRRLRRCRCRLQILVHAITFEQLFWFLSFLARLLALTHRLPDWILVDFGHDLDLQFSRSNMEFAISQPKMVWLPRNEKQTHRLNSRPQMWPSGLSLAMTLTLNFQGQIWNLLYLSEKWCNCHETKSKHIDWSQGLNCDHRVWLWPWPLPWIFKVKYGISYISAKPWIFKVKYGISSISAKNGPIVHETKSKHIDWTLGLKCDHQILPWPWRPWIFKVKYGICYISTKSGPIATKQKANILIELQASNVTNRFDLGHDLDIWIFKVKCDLDHLVTKVRCKDLPDSDRGDFRCRHAVDSSSCQWDH